jgi:hypothetical protein
MSASRRMLLWFRPIAARFLPADVELMMEQPA